MAKKYNAANPRLKVFADRFREYVNSAGGVNKVSSITGLSRVTIGFWYNGERTPDAANMITLANTTGVSVDWFLGLSESCSREADAAKAQAYTGLNEKICYALHLIDGVPQLLNAIYESKYIEDVTREAYFLFNMYRRIVNRKECFERFQKPDDELFVSVPTEEFFDFHAEKMSRYIAYAVSEYFACKIEENIISRDEND